MEVDDIYRIKFISTKNSMLKVHETYFRMTGHKVIKLSILFLVVMPMQRGEHFAKPIRKL